MGFVSIAGPVVLKGATVCSLAEQNLPPSAKILSGLRGALVLSGLQTNDGFSCSQLLLSKIALALLCGFGSQVGSLPLRVQICLQTNHMCYLNHSM